MIISILYLDKNKDLQQLKRELTQRELDRNEIELSFPTKALIVSRLLIDDNKVAQYPPFFLNQFEHYLLKFIAYSNLNFPNVAFREENKVFLLPCKLVTHDYTPPKPEDDTPDVVN